MSNFTDRFGDYAKEPNVAWDCDEDGYVVEFAIHADGEYGILWLAPKQARKYGRLLIEAAAVAKAENKAKAFDAKIGL
jgi:hypothetical protein